MAKPLSPHSADRTIPPPSLKTWPRWVPDPSWWPWVLLTSATHTRWTLKQAPGLMCWEEGSGGDHFRVPLVPTPCDSPSRAVHCLLCLFHLYFCCWPSTVPLHWCPCSRLPAHLGVCSTTTRPHSCASGDGVFLKKKIKSCSAFPLSEE